MTALSERSDIVKWVCAGGTACSRLNRISAIKCRKCNRERGDGDNAVNSDGKVVGRFTSSNEVDLNEVNGNNSDGNNSPATSASWED